MLQMRDRSLFPIILCCTVASLAVANAAVAVPAVPVSVPGQSYEAKEAPPAPGQYSKKDVDSLEQQMDQAISGKDIDRAIECARLLYEAASKQSDANLLAKRALDYSKLLIAATDYTPARLPLERSLKALDSSPESASKLLVINTLIQLGELSSFTADYQNAKIILSRAVTLTETYEGTERSKLQATALLRLAQCLDNSGAEATKTRELYEKSLAILNKDPGSDPLDVMDCLNNLATQLQAEKHYEEATSYMERALKLSRETNGEKHSDTAVIMNNLAMVYRDQQKLDQAMPLLDKAISILAETMGPEHMSVARVHESIGDIKYLKGAKAESCQDFLNAARIVNDHVFRELPGQSLAEQESFISSIIPGELSLVLSTCREGTALQESYGIVLNWKGLLIESMRQQKMIAALAGDSSSKALADKLEKLRADISGWYQMAGSVPYEEWKKTNDTLTSEKEHVERELANLVKTKFGLSFDSIDLKSLTSCMKDDEVFIDIFEYAPFGRRTDLHYAAFICSAAGNPKVQMVDLGTVREMALTIAHWRNEVFANRLATTQWQEMKTALWAPIAKLLPGKTPKIFLCPDGELARLPWQLFPNDTASGALLTEVDSARQFYELRKFPCQTRQDPFLLLAGGIDFNANPYASTGRTALPAVVKLPMLPGTLSEIKSIEALAQKDNIKVEVLSGANATKSTILNKLPQASFVHLATHGFFFDHNYVSAMKALTEEQLKGKRGVSVMPSFRKGPSTRLRSPLVESGLAVAGANLRDPGTTVNLGYITAEELVGLDLDKCEMMTLSACETGRGQEITGQGVLGLRSAIMSCGVRSILMSMWKVSDDSTSKLMNEFYNNLWTKHMSKSEALRQAQLSMMHDPNPALRNPLHWGAWVLVGEGW